MKSEQFHTKGADLVNMADSKSNRNSFAAKVATPKTTSGTSTPPAQAIPDIMESLGKAIGAR